jgi:hypothetical protein
MINNHAYPIQFANPLQQHPSDRFSVAVVQCDDQRICNYTTSFQRTLRCSDIDLLTGVSLEASCPLSNSSPTLSLSGAPRPHNSQPGPGFQVLPAGGQRQCPETYSQPCFFDR